MAATSIGDKPQQQQMIPPVNWALCHAESVPNWSLLVANWIAVVLACATPVFGQPKPKATVQNIVFDAGTVTFDLVNEYTVPLTAYSVEIRLTLQNGQTVMTGRSEDFGGIEEMEQGKPGNLFMSIPPDMRPIPPRGHRTITLDIRGYNSPIVAATGTVAGALFADHTEHGRADVTRPMKQARVEGLDRNSALIAALKIANETGERQDVLNALTAEAAARPKVAEQLLRFRAELDAMPGDIHQNLSDLITVLEAGRRGVQ